MTDETNREQSDEVKFFVYGGLFFRFELVPELDTGIRLVREKYGFSDSDELKFHSRSRPKTINNGNFIRAKQELLELCLRADCRFIAYVVHHDIAKAKTPDERLTFASDHVLKSFHDFLVEVKDTGLVLADPLPIKKPDQYARDKFQIGLRYGATNVAKLDRIHLYGQTGVGMSNLASLIDIVLGSFRYSINSPDSSEVGEKLFKLVYELMWHRDEGEKKLVSERGFILRPKEIKAQKYKSEYAALLKKFKRYALS